MHLHQMATGACESQSLIEFRRVTKRPRFMGALCLKLVVFVRPHIRRLRSGNTRINHLLQLPDQLSGMQSTIPQMMIEHAAHELLGLQ